jgi:hypothetical protein
LEQIEIPIHNQAIICIQLESGDANRLYVRSFSAECQDIGISAKSRQT